jgi:hypothetical protein
MRRSDSKACRQMVIDAIQHNRLGHSYPRGTLDREDVFKVTEVPRKVSQKEVRSVSRSDHSIPTSVRAGNDVRT